MTVTLGSFDHVVAMSDDIGTFEHAEHTEPRRGEGYCTDDMARVLIAAVLDPEPAPVTAELARLAFRFVADAQGPTGQVHNRRDEGGRWTDRPGVDDCWGRSVWALGTAARHAPEGWMRQHATALLDRGVHQRSPHRRSMAFAALGAAEMLEVIPGHVGSCRLLADAIGTIGRGRPDTEWPWPEPRLTYANATVCEALIAAGAALSRPDVLVRGLSLLGWLLDRETIDGHLSPTAVGGAGPSDRAPAFDQQPIEVAAMATACARAHRATGDERWSAGVEQAAAWFFGANDAGVVMWDPATGGGFDGLERDGANQNQGTESTLALIATMQLARTGLPVG